MTNYFLSLKFVINQIFVGVIHVILCHINQWKFYTV